MGFETSESYENEDLWQPYPELVAPDLDKKKMYEIVNSSAMPGMPTNGMTDKVRQVLYVPLESSGRSVSLHELAHVRWSPKRLPKHLGAPLMIVRAIEDARINLGLSNLEMPLDFAADLCADVLSIARQDVVRGDVVALTLRAVASFGTNIEHRLEGLLAVASEPIFASIRAVVGEARDRLQRARLDDPVASFDQGLCTARWLAAELKKLGLPEPQEGGVLVGCCGGVRKHGRPARLDRRLAALLDGMEGSTHTQVRPGRLRITTPPLLHQCTTVGKQKLRQYRAAAEGTEIRYIHRFVSDQAVFARPVPRTVSGGGSVLIDVSGSMCLRSADIDRIIAAAPEATLVAIYSGRHDKGELRVVVRDGYKAARAHLEPYGPGNIVDLPALEWLARQRAPRVWISDGGVTGCGDSPARNIRGACKTICKKAGILRVENAAAAAKALARPA